MISPVEYLQERLNQIVQEYDRVMRVPAEGDEEKFNRDRMKNLSQIKESIDEYQTAIVSLT